MVYTTNETITFTKLQIALFCVHNLSKFSLALIFYKNPKILEKAFSKILKCKEHGFQ